MFKVSIDGLEGLRGLFEGSGTTDAPSTEEAARFGRELNAFVGDGSDVADHEHSGGKEAGGVPTEPTQPGVETSGAVRSEILATPIAGDGAAPTLPSVDLPVAETPVAETPITGEAIPSATGQTSSAPAPPNVVAGPVSATAEIVPPTPIVIDPSGSGDAPEFSTRPVGAPTTTAPVDQTSDPLPTPASPPVSAGASALPEATPSISTTSPTLEGAGTTPSVGDIATIAAIAATPGASAGVAIAGPQVPTVPVPSIVTAPAVDSTVPVPADPAATPAVAEAIATTGSTTATVEAPDPGAAAKLPDTDVSRPVVTPPSPAPVSAPAVTVPATGDTAAALPVTGSVDNAPDVPTTPEISTSAPTLEPRQAVVESTAAASEPAPAPPSGPALPPDLNPTPPQTTAGSETTAPVTPAPTPIPTNGVAAESGGAVAETAAPVAAEPGGVVAETAAPVAAAPIADTAAAPAISAPAEAHRDELPPTGPNLPASAARQEPAPVVEPLFAETTRLPHSVIVEATVASPVPTTAASVAVETPALPAPLPEPLPNPLPEPLPTPGSETRLPFERGDIETLLDRLATDSRLKLSLRTVAPESEPSNGPAETDVPKDPRWLRQALRAAREYAREGGGATGAVAARILEPRREAVRTGDLRAAAGKAAGDAAGARARISSGSTTPLPESRNRPEIPLRSRDTAATPPREVDRSASRETIDSSPTPRPGLQPAAGKPTPAPGAAIESPLVAVAGTAQTMPGTAAPAPVETVRLPHEALAGAIADKAAATPRGGAVEVRFVIEPENLGPIQVRIESRGDQVKIRIVAASGAAVEALGSGLSQLNQQLNQAGIRHADIDLGYDDTLDRGNDTAQEQEEHPRRGRPRWAGGDDQDETPHTYRPNIRSRSRLDLQA